MGTTIDFATAFHPESNGQTEVTNRTILDLLCAQVHSQPRKWDKYIHVLRFAYNNTIHSPISKAPFEIVYGKLLPTPTTRLSNTNEAPYQIVVDFESIYSQVREALIKTQRQYTKQANKHRNHMIFNEGDFVMLRIEKRRLKSVETNPVVKLAPRFLWTF